MEESREVRATKTETLIRRHRLSTPTPGVIGDLQDLWAWFGQVGPEGMFDDRAQLIPDDTAIVIQWEEEVDLGLPDQDENVLSNENLLAFYKWLDKKVHSVGIEGGNSFFEDFIKNMREFKEETRKGLDFV